MNRLKSGRRMTSPLQSTKAIVTCLKGIWEVMLAKVKSGAVSLATNTWRCVVVDSFVSQFDLLLPACQVGAAMSYLQKAKL